MALVFPFLLACCDGALYWQANSLPYVWAAANHHSGKQANATSQRDDGTGW